MAAMEIMHKAMNAAHDADSDMDFAKMMIPHRQGAIDMAEIESKYGSDAKAKEEARKIIKENRKGIEDLQAWLDKKHKQ